MNIKTNLLEKYFNYVKLSLREHANFLDRTEKQNKYFKKIIVLFVIFISLFSFFG